LKRRIAAGDAATFRTELLALMDEIDKNWANIPWSDSPQGFDWNDFTKYQTLAKYLNLVDVHPRRGGQQKGGLHRLTFPMRGIGVTRERAPGSYALSEDDDRLFALNVVR
jgi:hypothetical protein